MALGQSCACNACLAAASRASKSARLCRARASRCCSTLLDGGEVVAATWLLAGRGRTSVFEATIPPEFEAGCPPRETSHNPPAARATTAVDSTNTPLPRRGDGLGPARGAAV